MENSVITTKEVESFRLNIGAMEKQLAVCPLVNKNLSNAIKKMEEAKFQLGEFLNTLKEADTSK